MRLPLVDGHGNFGSLDDGPAASRYTEARLAPAALLMTAEPRRGHRRLHPQLRRPAHPARGAARGVPQPARQRRAAASRSAWPPTWRRTTSSRSSPRPATSSRTPAAPRRPHAVRPRPRPAHRRQDRRARRHPRRLPRPAAAPSAPAPPRGSRSHPAPEGHRRHRAALPVGPEKVIEKIKDRVQTKKLQGISDVKDLTDRSTACGWSSRSRTASTPRRSSSSSTG